MGNTFGKYGLVRKLATGGMAEIWLARQTGMQGFEKPVVIKRILPHLSTDQVFVKMFLDEARVAACLNHPNIVQIYDLGCVDGQYFIAMEFVDGVDVSTVLKMGRTRKTPLKLRFTLRIVSQACEGLHHAHFLTDMNGQKLSLVHRDVSPQNILVSYTGNVKVTDFGIAKARGRSTKTTTGTLKGKFGYMSPEQISGGFVDHRSDVFSLGTVLWEMLTYRRLFKRDNEAATIMAVAGDEIPSPRRYWPKLPEELDRITMKALDRNIENRYQSARELGNALEQYLASQGLGVVSSEIAQFLDSLFPEKQLGARDASTVSGLSAAVYRDQKSGSVSLPVVTNPGMRSAAASSMMGPEISVPPGAAGPAAGGGAGEPAAGDGTGGDGGPPALPPGPEQDALAQAMRGVLDQIEPPAPEEVDDDDIEVFEEPAREQAQKHAAPAAPAPEDAGFGFPETEERRPGRMKVVFIAAPLVVAALAAGVYFGLGGATKGPAPAPAATAAAATPAAKPADGDAHKGQESAAKPAEAKPAVEPGANEPAKKEPKKKETKKAETAPKTAAPEKKVKETPTQAEEPKKEPAPPPKVATAAPVGDGFLNLDSDPWAEVWTGGSKLGDTPLIKVKVPSGRIQLVLKNPELGFEKKITIDVPANETVGQKISVKKGIINVRSDPPAEVYIGRTKVGDTPLSDHEVFEGVHKLRLVNREKGLEKAISVSVGPGQVKTINENLAK
ncbi:MAG: serine/threonine protein kinase [Deltaproteobacteria bacterium]|nr:serine/threonine protein kinase [Deltaproteobacteria bacterium]